MKVRFILLALLAVAGVTACGPKEQAPVKKDMCIQMYSARSLITPENYPDILKEMAAMGYTAVEAANYNGNEGLLYGDAPETFKEKVEGAGMKVLSSHVSRGLSREELDNHDLTAALAWWDKCIDVHKRAGMKYMVTPAIGGQRDLKDLQVYCDYLNEVGRRCKAAGIKYGYHNHAYEFEKVEGEVMYDYMLQHTDPDLVFFQMDVYWAVIGKASPVDYFKRYPGRFSGSERHGRLRRHLQERGTRGPEGLRRGDRTLQLRRHPQELRRERRLPPERPLREGDVLGVRDSFVGLRLPRNDKKNTSPVTRRCFYTVIPSEAKESYASSHCLRRRSTAAVSVAARSSERQPHSKLT